MKEILRDSGPAGSGCRRVSRRDMPRLMEWQEMDKFSLGDIEDALDTLEHTGRHVWVREFDLKEMPLLSAWAGPLRRPDHRRLVRTHFLSKGPRMWRWETGVEQMYSSTNNLTITDFSPYVDRIEKTATLLDAYKTADDLFLVRCTVYKTTEFYVCDGIDAFTSLLNDRITKSGR